MVISLHAGFVSGSMKIDAFSLLMLFTETHTKKKFANKAALRVCRRNFNHFSGKRVTFCKKVNHTSHLRDPLRCALVGRFFYFFCWPGWLAEVIRYRYQQARFSVPWLLHCPSFLSAVLKPLTKYVRNAQYAYIQHKTLNECQRTR